jgi:prolyl-tRNA synthetase
MSKLEKRTITKQSEDFSQWYLDIIREAELAEVAEVRGCGIVRPYGLKIWELIKAELNKRIEDDGVENVYFPSLVPIENLEMEKDHVEGFSPELAVVTHAGGEELANKLAIRPTSEAAMYKTYAKWIQSYNDLPLRLNQWANIVRWEKRPRPFLRWSEFLWQEGHTVYATEAEAKDEVQKILGIYSDIYKFMSIPAYCGKKSESEKFAGAVETYTVEVMSRDGKAIQGGTSHYLGTNFAKVFDVSFLGADGEKHFGHQNSWGLSWRSVGALIMAHGDDNGLRLPPNVAPIQIVIVPIFKDDAGKTEVLNYAQKLKDSLKGYRVKIDDKPNQTPGFKFHYWELKGVPIRLEIGLQEVSGDKVTLFRRDNNTKEIVLTADLEKRIKELVIEIADNLYQEAEKFSASHIKRIESWDEIDDSQTWFEASWSEDAESEKKLKERFLMVSRELPLGNENKAPKNKKCFITGKEAKHDWLFAKSY